MTGAKCDRTQFPIYDHEPTSKEEERIKAQLLGVPEDAIKSIRGMQPYLTPESRRSQNLLLLANLDNQDKHRVIHAVRTVVESSMLEMLAEKGPPASEVDFHRGLLEPGDVLLRWPSEYEFDTATGRTELNVAFGLAEATRQRLWEIRAEVHGIVESFKGFRTV